MVCVSDGTVEEFAPLAKVLPTRVGDRWRSGPGITCSADDLGLVEVFHPSDGTTGFYWPFELAHTTRKGWWSNADAVKMSLFITGNSVFSVLAGVALGQPLTSMALTAVLFIPAWVGVLSYLITRRNHSAIVRRTNGRVTSGDDN
jgi:hypothetical protein